MKKNETQNLKINIITSSMMLSRQRSQSYGFWKKTKIMAIETAIISRIIPKDLLGILLMRK